MEQSLKISQKKMVLQSFLAPVSLLTSKQSDLLKQWLKDYADIIAVITLPESIFWQCSEMRKSIFLF